MVSEKLQSLKLDQYPLSSSSNESLMLILTDVQVVPDSSVSARKYVEMHCR